MSWVTDFRELEPVAQRAPSAHNTQPWTLTYGADHVDIGWDPACALPVSDPTRRDLFLGLGAFVETCLIAAADTGLRVVADGLRLVPAATAYDTPFTVTDLEERRCARGRYEPGEVPPVGTRWVATSAYSGRRWSSRYFRVARGFIANRGRPPPRPGPWRTR